MALSTSEEARIQRIEETLSEHTTAIKNLASRKQLNHLLALVTKQIDELNIQVASLQSQVDALKK